MIESCSNHASLLTLNNTVQTFDNSDEFKKAFENILGKEENAGNQHFLLFPKCFHLCQSKNYFSHT